MWFSLLVLGLLSLWLISSMLEIDWKKIKEFKYDYPYDEEGRKKKAEILEEAKSFAEGKRGLRVSQDHMRESFTIEKRKLKFLPPSDDSYNFMLAVSFFVIWVITLFTVMMFRIGHEKTYLTKENEYKILMVQVERIENGDFSENYVINGEVGSLDSVYDDVRNYNNWIIKHQYWNDNPWFWIFYNQHADRLEQIELT